MRIFGGETDLLSERDIIFRSFAGIAVGTLNSNEIGSGIKDTFHLDLTAGVELADEDVTRVALHNGIEGLGKGDV